MTSNRLLLVHAHPDDESINNGATMAKYVAEGAAVTLVTCTAGEEGEVVVADLAHLAATHDDRLGETRKIELAAAMAELGVTDHRFLGGFGRFRDSGMIGTEPNSRPDCFWQADLLEAAIELVKVIREIRPQVMVTYDDFGGYGHPDHVKAHRVAMYASQLAAAPSFQPELGDAWQIQKIYWTAMPKSGMQRAIDGLKAQGIDNEFTQMNLDEMGFLCDDSLVTAVIDAGDWHEAKAAALRAHRTQIKMDEGFFAVLSQLDARDFGIEHYRLVFSQVALPIGVESDLFAGL